MLSCEFCKIFKNTYFADLLRTAASVFTFYVACSVRYAWIHNLCHTNICSIADLTFSGMQQMISRWINNRVYLFFEQTFITSFTLDTFFVFLTFFKKSPYKRTCSMVPSFMFFIFCLLFLCFLKFVFFSQVLQICYSTRCIFWHLEFPFNFVCQ